MYPLQDPRASYLWPFRVHHQSASPMERAGFRHGKSTIVQITSSTQDIKESFLAKKKASVVFVDLTAAYDTTWNCGLTCKLLRLLPDRHMVKMIMQLVTNCSFTLTTGSGTRSRLRSLKSSVPQGSVLAPLLYNINTNGPADISLTEICLCRQSCFYAFCWRLAGHRRGS